MADFLVFDDCSTSPQELNGGDQFTTTAKLRNPSFSSVIFDLALFVQDSNGNTVGSDWIARDQNLGSGSSREYTHTRSIPRTPDDYTILVQVLNEDQSGSGGFSPARHPAGGCGSCGP